jgi:hypothetical protein
MAQTPPSPFEASRSPLIEARSPLAFEMRLRSTLPSQLEALHELGRNAAGGLHVDEVAADSRVEDLAREAFELAMNSHRKERREPAVLDSIPARPVVLAISEGVESMRLAFTDLVTQFDGNLSMRLSAINNDNTRLSSALDTVLGELKQSREREAALLASVAALQADSTARFDRLEGALGAVFAAIEANNARNAALTESVQNMAAQQHSSATSLTKTLVSLSASHEASLAEAASSRAAAALRDAGELHLTHPSSNIMCSAFRPLFPNRFYTCNL